jgi:hypothetical protein
MEGERKSLKKSFRITERPGSPDSVPKQEK